MFQLRNNEIYMKAEDREFSTMAEERMACDYQGEEMLIGFNNTRMLDVLNNINADTVVVNLSGPARAGVFLPETQEEGEEMLVLLMPMMVS
jgi:DNA polymerase-3 subunit beta